MMLIKNSKWGILIYAHDWPIIYPMYRLKQYDTAVNSFVLKMKEPIFTLRGMYPTTLMRTVYLALTCSHDSLTLVGSERALRTHRQLPAYRYTTGWTHNPIPTITFIKLRSLCRMICISAIKDDDRITDSLCSIGR